MTPTKKERGLEEDRAVRNALPRVRSPTGDGSDSHQWRAPRKCLRSPDRKKQSSFPTSSSSLPPRAHVKDRATRTVKKNRCGNRDHLWSEDSLQRLLAQARHSPGSHRNPAHPRPRDARSRRGIRSQRRIDGVLSAGPCWRCIDQRRPAAFGFVAETRRLPRLGETGFVPISAIGALRYSYRLVWTWGTGRFGCTQ